jgi:hypothetical protein
MTARIDLPDISVTSTCVALSLSVKADLSDDSVIDVSVMLFAFIRLIRCKRVGFFWQGCMEIIGEKLGVPTESAS